MISKNIIIHDNPKSPISEAYRMLRTNLQYSSYDKKIKTIIVTSSGPGEGKSTTMGNLAVAMAQAGKKILLIDGDLRKPKVHKYFGMTNIAGVTNVIVEDKDYRTLVQTVHDIPSIQVLTSGPMPPNPSELLGSLKMKSFIDQVAEEYDTVLIDAPPVGSVTDAAILSTLVDGVIFVVSSGTATIEAAKRAKELLEKVKANILGVVVNKIKKSTAGGSYYYYYYSYYYGEESENKKKKNKKNKENKAKRDFYG